MRKKCEIFFAKRLQVSKKSLPLHPQLRRNLLHKRKVKIKSKKSSKKFGGYKKRSYLCTHVRLRKCGDFFSASPKGEKPKKVL